MDVLSIDFDIIMGPSIEYYNHMVPNRTWKDIDKENPMLINPKADLAHYTYLLCLLNKVVNENIPIYVAYNHKKILDFLKNDTNINLINIDHHHDFSYNPEGIIEQPNCANWVRILFENQQLNSCLWAKNSNSQLPLDIVIEKFKECNYAFEDFNLLKDKILNIHFDKIFICLSPEWVPPYYYTLFYGLLDLLNQKLNCHLKIHEDE
jgi:hypothetical protein